MKLLVNQNYINYKKDSIRYYIYQIFNIPFKIFTLVYIIIVILNFLLNRGYIDLYPNIIKPLSFAMPFGIIGMLIYSGYYLFIHIKKLNSHKQSLYEGEVTIKLTEKSVLIQMRNNKDFYSIKWEDIKEMRVLNNTIFLIPINKDDFIVRINKKEIIQGDFEEVLFYIKSLWNKSK